MISPINVVPIAHFSHNIIPQGTYANAVIEIDSEEKLLAAFRTDRAYTNSPEVRQLPRIDFSQRKIIAVRHYETPKYDFIVLKDFVFENKLLSINCELMQQVRDANVGYPIQPFIGYHMTYLSIPAGLPYKVKTIARQFGYLLMSQELSEVCEQLRKLDVRIGKIKQAVSLFLEVCPRGMDQAIVLEELAKVEAERRETDERRQLVNNNLIIAKAGINVKDL